MPIDLTGIQNVGEFYSHHYLDALLENDLRGLFTRWRLSEENEDDDPDTDTPEKQFNRQAADYFKAKSGALNQQRPSTRYRASHALHVQLLEALGYPYDFGVQYLLDGRAVPTLCQLKRDGRAYLTIVETIFTDPDESPLDNHLLREQYPPHETQTAYDRPSNPWEDVLGELFRVDEPPRWILLMAGRLIYLLDRQKWGQGQYLLFDLDEIYGRRQSAALRAVAALLSRDALAPDDGVPLHDTLDENSHKHAYGVSTDLKYGVRKAVELLANEYVWYQRNIGKQALFTDEGLAGSLTRECLTYLYRLLFLFYAEARSSELGLVPMQAEAYRTGYSLEALRDLEQVPLHTPQAQNGYFIDESLNTLFQLVNEGFPEFVIQQELSATGETVYDNYGFTIAGLRSPLFDRQATPRLSAAKFRNTILQEILQLLSLSKEGRGRNSNRGRISYAQLGINQLGAVYEGLLSYSGFFAQETLYEVKPAGVKQGDEMDQTYFIPESDLARYEPDEFLYETDEASHKRRKRYPKGAFIFRLAGRDREKSASYYTPEVLTACVVKYSLKELLGQSPEDENWKSADEILQLTICEPAMGSGAFINEAINQLADAYLQRKQVETGQTLSADDYRLERQKVKAHLALHNAYGVDLNPMAAELAQVSIWLNTIYPGMPAPWFHARLSVGNSLIGARRQVYSAADILSGAYANKAPTAIPLSQPRPKDSVYHWLLPDKGMAAFDGDKVIKDLAPAEVQAIKEWRKEFTGKIGKAELQQLQTLSAAADDLWQRHTRDRLALLEQTQTPINLWGQSEIRNPKSEMDVAARQSALDRLNRPTSPYRRLKLAMDAWCALWFWPIPEAGKLPSRADFLADMAALLLGPEHGFDRPPEQLSLLADSAPRQRPLAEAPLIDVDALIRQNERLAVAAQVQAAIRFHHWELAFAELFQQRGGFDLIVGNPPWVKHRWNEKTVLADYDALIEIRGFSASQVASLRKNLLFKQTQNLREYLLAFSQDDGIANYLNAISNYSLLVGLQINLYKCFIVQAWALSGQRGVVSLLHPEGIFDDSKGGAFRKEIYLRLNRIYRFTNVLKLFAEILHWVNYCICVYSERSSHNEHIQFQYITNVFHPVTIEQCITHDGFGEIPGIKNLEEHWNLRGHKTRLLDIDYLALKNFAVLFDKPDTPPIEARLPSVHTTEILQVLNKFADQNSRIGSYTEQLCTSPSTFWNETAAQKDGTIRKDIRFPNNPSEWIISGPHFYVATPLNKTPNEDCKNPLDYSDIDLPTIKDDYLPRTIFVPACSQEEYIKRIPKWQNRPLSSYYRHIHRRMLSQTGERTLINAIIPPGPTHTNLTMSLAATSNYLLTELSGLCSSIVFDFFIKITGKGDLYEETLYQLPFPRNDSLLRHLRCRTLRLNCLTNHYSELWEGLFEPAFKFDTWASKREIFNWGVVTSNWTRDIGFRTALERRQALIEIDVLAALAIGLTLQELLTIYVVQFPVLQKHERRLIFDQRGFVVPIKTVRGELVVNEADPTFPDMVPPFTPVDREADYRQAWAHFEKRLREEEIALD